MELLSSDDDFLPSASQTSNYFGRKCEEVVGNGSVEPMKYTTALYLATATELDFQISKKKDWRHCCSRARLFFQMEFDEVCWVLLPFL